MEDISASDNERADGESVYVSDTSKTERSDKGKKPRKRTPRASKQDLDTLRANFSALDGKVDSLMAFLRDSLASNKDTESSALPRPEASLPSSENVTCAQRQCSGPVVDNHDVGVCQDASQTGRRPPLVTLNNTLNRVYNLSNPDDALSIQPSRKERHLLIGSSDDESHSHVSQGGVSDTTGERFTKYKNDNSKLLADIFGEDASDSTTSKNGIVLDDSQVKVLQDSWRCDEPVKISSYREAYRHAFPVSETSEDILKVPSLDDIVENLLFKRFGNKAISKGQSLYSQPLKSLEKIAYQGQYAARMGIVINSYVQQALGKLLLNLQDDACNMDRAIQCVRDIFAMSNKSLDQVARCGALFHLIRRKATMEDTGLAELKDIKPHVWNLPLSGKGVFGDGLEKTLRDRQEMNKQISDLLPEVDRKRKSVSYSSGPQYKKPRYSGPKDDRSYRPPYNNYGSQGKNTGRPATGTLRNYTIPKFSRTVSQKTTGVSSFRSKAKSQ